MNYFVVGSEETLEGLITQSLISSNRYLLVQNKECRIIGTISQGDLLRAIVSGNENLKAFDVMNSNFLYVREGQMETASELMKSEKLVFLPILDGDGLLKGVFEIWGMK